MKKRTEPRNIPQDAPLYWEIEIPGKGTFTFRTPFPLHSARILQEMLDKGLMDYQKDGKAKEINLEGVKFDEAIDLWRLNGAAVGYCWMDRDHDLEANPKRFDSIYDFGEAVLEELYEVGWEMADFRVLFPQVMKRVTASFLGVKEVKDRADFSAPTSGDSN